jgi:hypothetical protein
MYNVSHYVYVTLIVSFRLGRRTTSFVAGIPNVLVGATSALVPNFYAFVVLRFLHGVLSSGKTMAGFIFGKCTYTNIGSSLICRLLNIVIRYGCRALSIILVHHEGQWSGLIIHECMARVDYWSLHNLLQTILYLRVWDHITLSNPIIICFMGGGEIKYWVLYTSSNRTNLVQFSLN